MASTLDQTLAQLAEKLGVEASRLWPLLVRETLMCGWAQIVAACAYLIIFTLVLRWLLKRPRTEYSDASLVLGMVGLPGGAIAVIAFVFLFDGALMVLNPEARTLRALLP